MQKFTTLILILTLMITASLLSQSVGDYRTKNSGNWNNAQIWERYNGSSWAAVATPPTGGETITVLAADSVFVNVLVSITDTLINQGIVEANNSLTFASGGTYQHDRDAGKIPIATWEQGSTLYMTGVTGVAPDDRNQSYYNMTFNTPGLLSNLNMALDSVTIGGDVKVIDTGSARWYLTSALSLDTSIVTVMGDIIVENGALSSQGTSNAQTTIIIHHYGNILVTGGNFSVARGSQGSGTGSTRWYLYGDDFSMENATTQNSNPANAWFVFAKQGTQTLTLGAGNTLTALPFEVSSGTTLDMGSSVLAGAGIVLVDEGGTVLTSLAGGIEAVFSGVTASVTLADGSGYGFNGTTAQITSTRMPATVTDLIINNPAGVTLSQETTINGLLRLMAGVFDNTIPFIMGPNGSISYEGGSLLIPVSIESLNLNIPKSFFVEQNHPNPFNPSTTIRFGLPAASDVTVKVFNLLGQEVMTLFNGRMQAGRHQLLMNAANLSSGIYLYQIQAGENMSVKRMVLLK
jgi:Secretion system C-terminal sorting domain